MKPDSLGVLRCVCVCVYVCLCLFVFLRLVVNKAEMARSEAFTFLGRGVSGVQCLTNIFSCLQIIERLNMICMLYYPD